MKNISRQFLFVICLCLVNLTSLGASFNEKISLVLKVPNENLRTLAGQNPLIINFCEITANSQQNKDLCAKPSRPLQISGQNINEQVSITPNIDGDWRGGWNYKINFTPTNNFLANQTYKVTINTKDIFPDLISLKSNNISFKTLPLLPIIKNMNYLQDNSAESKKIVQAQIVFNYPIDPTTLKERIEIIQASNKEKLPFELKINQQNTEAIVIANIKKLGVNEDIVSLNIKDGVKPLYGGEDFFHENVEKQNNNPANSIKYSYNDQVLIPSLSSYLKVSNATAVIVKNQKLVPEQMVIITTNAPVSSMDLKNHLELFLLPEDKPHSSYGASGSKNYKWKSPIEITEDILNLSEKIEFELLPISSENNTTHSFKINVPDHKYLLLVINKGVKGQDGLILGQNYTQIVQTPADPQEIKLMSNGSILSLAGEKKLSVYSIGIDTLSVEIDKINQEDINHLVSQTKQYNTFQNPTFINKYSFNEYNISEVFREDIIIAPEDSNIPSYTTLDFGKYLEQGSKALSPAAFSKGLFLTKVFSKDKDDNIIAQDKRLILVTDLGFMVKTDKDGTQHIFVSNISSGTPASKVKVDIISLNGEILESGLTDDNGHTILSGAHNFTEEKTPVAYVLTSSEDFSFMPYGRIDRQVNYSRFDIAGTVSSREGLKAYLFSDRDIYKPGEQGHVGIIVKQTDWREFAGLPLKLQVTNPRGKIIDEVKIVLDGEGFAQYLFKTENDSPTGSYNVNLSLVNDKYIDDYLNNISLNVQDFQPDRMKITVDFEGLKNTLWNRPDDLKAIVNLTNFYGTKAQHRKVTAYIDIKPTQFIVPAFKDYKFYNTRINKEVFNEYLGDSITDEQGKAQFNLNLEKYYNATFNLTFTAQGFEPDSGRSVRTNKSVIVSTLPYIIGFKTDSDLKYLKQQTTPKIEFIAISNKGDKVGVSGLKLELKKINYVNNLVADANGSYFYQSVPVETNVISNKIDITAKDGYIYNLPTEKAGDYKIYLTDSDNVVFAQTEFSVSGDGNNAGNLTEKAGLTVKLDKNSYKSGDNISLNIIAPYTGYGLITIETDKVHNYTWFKANTTSSIQKIKIPEGFEGKGFVNVQFIKDADSNELFISPFSYAVTPFTADIDKYKQDIELSLPEKIKSGEKLTIGYRASNPGKIIIFAVDEGILSFAGYKTPDPLDYFIKDKALEVTTSQIMDLILPENSHLMKALMIAAPGGDYSININRNLNPFKRKDQPPVAFWSGILDTGQDMQEITFDIPSYFNGTLRVMAVSSASQSVGSTASKLLVQSDFIINPNLPLFVAPNDEFIVPVTIANNLKNSANAKVLINIETSDGLKLLDYPQTIEISENKEHTINVKLKATDKLGSADFKVTASLNEAKSEVTVTTSVRPPLPNVTTVDTGFTKTDKASLKVSRDLYKEFAKLQISVSKSPLAIISGFKSFLDDYPFGCTEQLVSQNFVNVLLYNEQELVKILKSDRIQMDESLLEVFQTLTERQNYDGGFNNWGGTNSDNSANFISVYAMHFLTEGANRYLAVPNDTFNQGINYLKNMVNRPITSLNDAREKAYAIYILTRNNEITTNYIANILNYLNNDISGDWHNDLTSIYLAASYKMLQLNEEADKLLSQFTLDKPINSALLKNYQYYDPLIKYSQYLYLISLHFPERLNNFDKKTVQDIALLAKDSYNTLSASYAIMASLAYANNIDNIDKSAVTVKAYGGDKKQPTEIKLEGSKIMLAELQDTNIRELDVNSSNAGFFYQLLISGYDKALKENKAISKGIEISKKYFDKNNKEVSKITLGDNITVELTMRSGSNQTLNNIVVLDLLPSGFELLPASSDVNILNKNDANNLIWKPIYTDRRDDRIMIFGTITDHELKYQYKIKAVNKGIFALPAIYGESMYDPKIYYRGTIGSIIVE